MKFAIMGHGVVGSGTAQLFLRNADSIMRAAGEEMTLKYILDIKDFDGLDYRNLFIKDFSIIESDPEISVVVETIGGVGAAYEFVSRCLKAGKSVVTSNKEMIATKGTELMGYAAQSGAMLKFEASVGGGIPLLKPMSQCLAANRILYVDGILNGTTNFILTKMETEGMSFESALELAKKLGYAELNPSADVDGIDCVRKISIICGLAFGKHPDPNKIPTVGIRSITSDDIMLAKAFGLSVKLIARAKCDGGNVTASVRPMAVSGSNLLSSVNDVFNAVLVNGDATGDVLFYGKGAGKFPTASAVISDVTDCVREKASQRCIKWVDTEAFVADSGKYRRLVRYCTMPTKLPQGFGEVLAVGTTGNCFGLITEPMTDAEADRIMAAEKPEAVFPVLE